MQSIPLFESQNLRLTPLEPEKDAPILASWSYDLETAYQLRQGQPARPMPAFEVRKVCEQWEKEAREDRQFLFAVHSKQSDAILGVIRICWMSWVNGAAYLDVLFNKSEDWQSIASEALNMALRYAFEELALFRVTAVVPGHDQAAADLYHQANFTLEVRQRQAIYWHSQNWDKLYFGMLRPEWKMQQAGVLA